jgi:LDH2 family malate/lactate/ureidoglycolate dehydrogenase
MERNASEEDEFHQADVLFGAELTDQPSHGPQQLHRVQRGLIESRTRSEWRWRSHAILEVDGGRDLGLGPAGNAARAKGGSAALAGSALAPDIRGMLNVEFVCKADVIPAIDLGSAPESVPRLSGYLDLVRAAPPLKTGAPVSSPGDSAAWCRAEAFENGFETEPRLWSEFNGLAQSNSSFARGYAL